jgi:hypothetical protein
MDANEQATAETEADASSPGFFCTDHDQNKTGEIDWLNEIVDTTEREINRQVRVRLGRPKKGLLYTVRTNK